MSVFVILAAVMAAIAAAAVALPLLRDRHSRLLGAFAALVVAGTAAGLYPLWSNWNWHAAAQAQASAADVQAMIAKLESHLRDQPQDLTGWLMVGRSYLALERVDDAVAAYEHARSLAADNVDAVLGLGEALSLRAGGNITPPAGALFEQAWKLAPSNPKALLYSGFAAATRGDTATARARWQALKDLHPPEPVEKMLDARLAELDSARPTATPAAATAPAADGAQATFNLSIAPGLQARLTHEAPLFVFAREPGGAGAPLAAKRLTSAAIGTRIELSAADSMIAGRALKGGQRVSITARVSFSGQPLPAAGDLYGEVTYDVGHDGVRDLVIDRVAD